MWQGIFRKSILCARSRQITKSDDGAIFQPLEHKTKKLGFRCPRSRLNVPFRKLAGASRDFVWKENAVAKPINEVEWCGDSPGV